MSERVERLRRAANEIRILGSVGHCIHDPGDCAKCNQQNRCLSNETLTPEAKKTLETRLAHLGREEF